jgi:hypothetical protein
LLPITYKNCWDTDGEDPTFDYVNNGYVMKKPLKDASLIQDILNLKQTIINKDFEDKIFWVTPKSTNGDISRILK